MTRHSAFGSFCFAALVAVSGLLIAPRATAQQTPADADETYLLRYSLQAGQQLHYEVTHVAKTKTRINGAEEVSQVHTTSQRRLDVTNATDAEMTFNHVIDSVEMSQQQGDAEETRWDSRGDDQPPPVFERVASQLGENLATITVNARGQETGREDDGGTKASLGMGSLTLSLPEEPIAVGTSWIVPREIRTRTEDGEVKVIKIHERYTLEKVKTGVALISVRSEPITPINEESIRAQVVQQLSDGTLRFDIDNGYMLSKQLDWDETVVGFQGHNSMMEYRAKLTETLIEGEVPHTARR